jgi:hypothetical protein
MSLKLLAIPLLVIGTLVIAIGYVKPDVSLLFAKQKQIENRQLQLDSLNTIGAHIASMQSQIASSQSDSESSMNDADFLRRVYFPASSDIEKGIDQLNFLADQSGVVVSSVVVEDAKKVAPAEVVPEESMEASADLLIADGAGVPEDVAPVVIHRTYTPGAFTVTIETAGSYEATKDFYARMVHAQRFFFPQTLELTNKDGEGSDAPGGAQREVSADTLFSSVVVEFLILPTVSIASAVGDDAFDKASLNFETLAMIRKNKEGATPELPVANPIGKANLFIK